MNEAQRDQLLSIIENVNDMTIATVRDDGFPQATTVSFVSDGLKIYFATSADSQKARNIEKNDKVSITLDCPYGSWEEIRSLSAAGHAVAVDDPDDIEKIWALMLKKFPQAAGYETIVDTAVTIFRIDPVIFSLLDYSKEFGHTELVEV
tara:strand:- start:2897 stop:3343 length:447 start_codon:yes stop_codon:yes gene_type:complete